MIKTTVEKLRIAKNICDVYKKNITKFGYACLRSSEKIKSCINKYDEELMDRRNELSLSDEKTKKVLLDEEDNYVYTKEHTRTLQKFIDSQGKIEVEYEPYFAKDFSEIKSLEILDALNGIVINIDDIETYIDSLPKKEETEK